MDNDPNQPQPSSYGQQPPLQSEQSQEPLWYESPPQWGQQPPPQYRQSPYGQLPYEVSPIPDSRPPQQPKKRSRRWLWITLAIIGGLIALGCIALFVALSVGSFVRLAGPVTNLNDNGPGSLRQIIANAKPGSTITFDKSLRGTILLTSGDLNIAKDLTIRGPGADILSISGGKSGHIVRVVQGVSVTISGLTFKDSNTSDGFILNQGTLMLNNSTVSGNTSSGPSGAGGGIFNQGTLTLNNSTVSGNTATFDGGGIFNQYMLTLNNSTVSGNTATSAGGGIDNNGGTLTLNNSTVSGNRVTASGSIGGGIYNNGGTLTLNNSIVSGNTGSYGGGIDNNSGTLTLNNSTVSGNTPTDIFPSP